MRIVLAGPDDAPLVHRIMHEAFDEYRGVLDPPSSAHAETVADVVRALAAGGGALAWLSGEAVGSARYGHQPDHLYIGRISVLPTYRGRGIGGALVTFLEGHARTSAPPRCGSKSAWPWTGTSPFTSASAIKFARSSRTRAIPRSASRGSAKCSPIEH